MNYANRAYGLYLEHSYRYYELSWPLITDAQFDSLCVALLEQWDEVTHRFKHLTDVSALQAGTGYQLFGKLHPAIMHLCSKYREQPLVEVFDKMKYYDKYEEQAHDIICIIKFGGVGGTVRTQDMVRIADYLRGGPKPRAALPLPVPSKPVLPLPLPLPKAPVLALPLPLPLPLPKP